MRWLDGRDDLRWYQHRHPDPTMRMIGLGMMAGGLVNMVMAVLMLL